MSVKQNPNFARACGFVLMSDSRELFEKL